MRRSNDRSLLAAASGPHQPQCPVVFLSIFKIIPLTTPPPEQPWHLPKWPYKPSWLWVTLSLSVVTWNGTQVLCRGSVCSWSLSMRSWCYLVRSGHSPCWLNLQGNRQKLWEVNQPCTQSEGHQSDIYIYGQGRRKEQRASYLAKHMNRSKSGHQDCYMISRAQYKTKA